MSRLVAADLDIDLLRLPVKIVSRLKEGAEPTIHVGVLASYSVHPYNGGLHIQFSDGRGFTLPNSPSTVTEFYIYAEE